MFQFFSVSSSNNNRPVEFYNSATRTVETFTPLKGKVVTMYSCGPTVYGHIHIGNLRAYLLPDLIKRVLMFNGYQVKHTINFTDFGHLTDDGDAGEDKIMKGMKRDGYEITLPNMLEFALPYIQSFRDDNERFGNIEATTYARASDYIKEQIKLVETLFEKGYAYETSDGVYFDIEKFPAYGKLGPLDLNAMKAGARVVVNEEKRHPADFALWKKSELGWKSRFGTGFPGWHIECTAMAFATLGKQIDIHTGGEDLLHTHHNGEIAQAECVTGKEYVRYWLHNNHVTMNDSKMAKSSGNVLTLTNLIERGYSAEDYRFWLLQSHYRTTVNFSFEALDAAKQALTRLKRLVYEELGDQPVAVPDSKYEDEFSSAVNQDLDTPKAITILFAVAKDSNLNPAVKLATIHVIDSVLEVGLSHPVNQGLAALGHLPTNNLPDEIQALIIERDLARTAQNWPESDRLRDVLTHKGYKVEDTKDGTRVSQA